METTEKKASRGVKKVWKRQRGSATYKAASRTQNPAFRSAQSTQDSSASQLLKQPIHRLLKNCLTALKGPYLREVYSAFTPRPHSPKFLRFNPNYSGFRF